MQESYTFACGRFYLAVIELTGDGDRKERLHGAALDYLNQINPDTHLPESLRPRFRDVFDEISSQEAIDNMSHDDVPIAAKEVVSLFGALCEYETPES